MCMLSRCVTRRPVMPSVSTSERGCVATSVPFTRKRTVSPAASTESVFIDEPGR